MFLYMKLQRSTGQADGNSSKKLTMPFMLFSTMPVLLGQFIGNFNNFGIFYFLRGGHISMSKKWKFGRMMDTGITYLILTAVAFVFFSRVSG